mmetsp:Transcript_8789/g.29295  ORF Transcript_8789/g.29295 Transcript_8789/m.29295 type:complete len:306 (+) Transcript_8789:2539-3456(+)
MNIGLVATNLRATWGPLWNFSRTADALRASSSSPADSANSKTQSNLFSNPSQYRSRLSVACERKVEMVTAPLAILSALVRSCAVLLHDTASLVSLARKRSRRAKAAASAVRASSKNKPSTEKGNRSNAHSSNEVKCLASVTAESAAARLVSASRSASPASRATLATLNTRASSASRVASKEMVSNATSVSCARNAVCVPTATTSSSEAFREAQAACDERASRTVANASRVAAASANGVAVGSSLLNIWVPFSPESGVETTEAMYASRLNSGFSKSSRPSPAVMVSAHPKRGAGYRNSATPPYAEP